MSFTLLFDLDGTLLDTDPLHFQAYLGLLEDHLAHCVVDAARQGDPSAKVKEASDAIARLVRS